MEYNKFSDKAKVEILDAINGKHNPDGIEDVVWGRDLDQQTVHAGMEELRQRLCKDIPGVFLLPPAVCTAYAISKPTEVSEADFIKERDASLFICGVVWATSPAHYTLIRAQRQSLHSAWEPQFWDPYSQELPRSREAAENLLMNLGLLPATSKLPLPAPGPQLDGWSCGLQVLAKMEAWMREWRGEQPGPDVDIAEVQLRLNEFLWVLKGPAPGGPHPAAGISGPAAEATDQAAKHATLEEALTAAHDCKKCRVNKSILSKGCSECMGTWFNEIRLSSRGGRPRAERR